MKIVRFTVFALALLSLLAFTSVLTAQRADAVSATVKREALPFEPLEESVYEAEFSRSLLRGINVATLRFIARRVNATANVEGSGATAATASTLLFTADAESKGLFPKLFSGLRFRQHIESTVEPNLFTVIRTVKLDEQGNRKRASEAVFDLETQRVTWTERVPNDPTSETRVVSNEFKGTVQDLASVFYFIRTQKLVSGQNFEVNVSDSGQVYRIPIRVGEKKRQKTILGQVETIRVTPELFGEGRLIRGKGQIHIWFTTDERRVAVRAEIKHEMGTLDIKLKSIKKN